MRYRRRRHDALAPAAIIDAAQPVPPTFLLREKEAMMSYDQRKEIGKPLASDVERGDDAGTSAPLKQQRLRFRAVLPIIRAAGLLPWAAVFAGGYAIATCTVAACEPGIGGIGDAAWLMFQVVTTIGLGDFTCTTLPGRLSVIALSTYSVFFLALITGAVVSYCQERMAARRNESVAHFIDQLEHLPELSRDELAELSEKVKRIENRRRS